MASDIAAESEERDLVENMRSTGYGGREPWIPALDPVTGTLVVVARQLEACATYPACAWRDEVADDSGLWSFARHWLLKPLLSFARVAESVPVGHVCDGANGDDFLAIAWRNVSQLLDRLTNAEPSKTSYAETAVSLLLAVMVLRQIVDAEARDKAADQAHFLPFSTNVHPSFLPTLFDKLGSTVIDLSEPVLLSDMCRMLDAWLRAGRA